MWGDGSAKQGGVGIILASRLIKTKEVFWGPQKIVGEGKKKGGK
jgi:hypothetical protein